MPPPPPSSIYRRNGNLQRTAPLPPPAAGFSMSPSPPEDTEKNRKPADREAAGKADEAGGAAPSTSSLASAASPVKEQALPAPPAGPSQPAGCPRTPTSPKEARNRGATQGRRRSSADLDSGAGRPEGGQGEANGRDRDGDRGLPERRNAEGGSRRRCSDRSRDGSASPRDRGRSELRRRRSYSSDSYYYSDDDDRYSPDDDNYYYNRGGRRGYRGGERERLTPPRRGRSRTRSRSYSGSRSGSVSSGKGRGAGRRRSRRRSRRKTWSRSRSRSGSRRARRRSRSYDYHRTCSSSPSPRRRRRSPLPPPEFRRRLSSRRDDEEHHHDADRRRDRGGRYNRDEDYYGGADVGRRRNRERPRSRQYRPQRRGDRSFGEGPDGRGRFHRRSPNFGGGRSSRANSRHHPYQRPPHKDKMLPPSFGPVHDSRRRQFCGPALERDRQESYDDVPKGPAHREQERHGDRHDRRRREGPTEHHWDANDRGAEVPNGCAKGLSMEDQEPDADRPDCRSGGGDRRGDVTERRQEAPGHPTERSERSVEGSDLRGETPDRPKGARNQYADRRVLHGSQGPEISTSTHYPQPSGSHAVSPRVAGMPNVAPYPSLQTTRPPPATETSKSGLSAPGSSPSKRPFSKLDKEEEISRKVQKTSSPRAQRGGCSPTAVSEKFDETELLDPGRKKARQRAQEPQPPQAMVVDFYDRIGQVGEGTYGKVYKARNRVTGELVALKRIRMEAEKDGFPITSLREIKLLQSLDHVNILKLKEMLVVSRSVYMVLDYMDYDLAGILSHPHVKLQHRHVKCLIQQLLAGLAYLHERGVLHRDIKGSNLLVNARGELKIADFGLARITKRCSGSDYTNRVVTLWYRPPELLLGATLYGPEVDVWSAGCMFMELLVRKPIFPGNDEISQLTCIYKLMGTPTPETWPGMERLPWYNLIRTSETRQSRFWSVFKKFATSAALDLVEAMLAFDPTKRPSAAECLRHPYFTEEEPPAAEPSHIPLPAGDWHEYESKQRRRRRNSSKADVAAAAAAAPSLSEPAPPQTDEGQHLPTDLACPSSGAPPPQTGKVGAE